MIRFIIFLFAIVVGFSGVAQELNDYSYIVIPSRFEVQAESDQYMLNDMAHYYFDKYGFNAFMEHEAPNAPRCDGLYVDVEEKMLLMGTGLYLVLRDCNNEEVYRSEQARSKHKEFRKAYQDKLRKAFKDLEKVAVKQKEIAYYSESISDEDDRQETPKILEISKNRESENEVAKHDLNKSIPSSATTQYTAQGGSFILQKTGEGYSLYNVGNSGDDDLQLVGKIIVMNAIIKFMDMNGNVSDAVFDTNGNFTIGQKVYKKSDN